LNNRICALVESKPFHHVMVAVAKLRKCSSWLAIGATLLALRPVNRVAAWLLAPYLAWVSFAAVLNFALWRLNR
jgi:tryptophan-rich sensory protein